MKRRWLSLICIMVSSSLHAMTWQDLWLSDEARGVKALQQQQPQTAAQLFHHPTWQGVAHYRSGDYETAEKLFAAEQTALAHYNRGNALAHLGRYQEALAAYNQALELNNDFLDAKFNRDLLQQYLNMDSTVKPRNDKEQQSQDDKKQQQQQQQQQSNQNMDSRLRENDSAVSPPHRLKPNDKEKEQAQQQWLRRVKDNPPGLLRHKFLRDHHRYQEHRS